MFHGIGDCGAFEAAMDHAVGALLIFADAVLVPFRVFHQLLESRHIAFAKQVAGLLPTEHRPRRHAPRRAFISLIAGKKIQEQFGLRECPFLAAITARKHVAEKLLGALSIAKMLLVCTALAVVA